MNLLVKKTFMVIAMCLLASFCKAQLVITNEASAQALVQKLVGEGISISNVTFTGDPLQAGYFKNTAHTTSIVLDSGIVLTSGSAKSSGSTVGLDGNESSLANTNWLGNGDADIAASIGSTLANTHDACVLEFDFVPLGDSIKFRYVFSSEEYTELFVCDFNDAFGFFISGPGFTGLQNIALVPGTTTPVSIFNVNDVFNGSCPNNINYFIDNTGNGSFTHEGHTTVLAALAQVQPCQTYHLKLVISDVGDGAWDSGVFLEAKSLTSNAFQLTNLTQIDPLGNSYLVEGCAVGSLLIRRPEATLFSQTINLGYAGTVTNGVDVQTLPSSITIPANETEVLLNIFPTIDNIPEGIETLKIYTLAACGQPTPTDSTVIQIRDYDTLGVAPDTAIICPGASIQLNATAGYINYQWEANPGLSSLTIRDPVATPSADSTVFYCTSEEGTCHGRDSAFIYWKKIKLISTRDVNCHGASTGQITVGPGTPAWIAPLEYAIDNAAFQPGNTFNNLPVGTYTVKIKDATGCIDSILVNIIQAYPDLVITNTSVTNGSCTGTLDGSVTITASGGKAPLLYSIDGTNFQSSNTFSATSATYTVTVKDDNGCTASMPNVVVTFNNSIVLSTGAAPTICEGKSTTLPASTNATSFAWTPAATLNNASLLNPVASPTATTKYYVTVKLGICDKLDSVMLYVNPAPVANAGKDSTICYGADTRLSGSGGTDFKWEPATYLSATDVRDPIVIKPATIKYYLTVKDANGCFSLSKDDMLVTVSKPAKLFAGNDTIVAMNQPLQLNAVDVNNTGFVKYNWTPSWGLNNSNIHNPILTTTDFYTLFIVTASTINSCEGIDSIKVKTYKGPDIYVPNSFTPNGDGNNDVLKAFPVGIRSFSYFKVFNRYGQLVFYTTNENEGWDGKIKGSFQNMSSFVWIAEAIDFTGKKLQRKGTTTIIQ